MQRIAPLMVGGMITAPPLSRFVIPAIYLLIKRRELGVETEKPEEPEAEVVEVAAPGS